MDLLEDNIFDYVPYETILRVVDDLPIDDVVNLCQTNQLFSNICSDWKYWSTRALKDFGLPKKAFFVNNVTAVQRYDNIMELLSNPIDNFLNSVSKNNVMNVETLLNFVDPSIENNKAIIIATEKGYLDMVKLLLTDLRVNPSVDDNYALIEACRRGYAMIVKKLLSDKRVSPVNVNANPLTTAIDNNNPQIVKILLEDGRINPASLRNHNIIIASEKGYNEIVKLLLNDNRVNPSDRDNEAIILASTNGNVDAVKTLLMDNRVNPSVRNNEAIEIASFNGHLDIVEILLMDDRVKRVGVYKLLNPDLVTIASAEGKERLVSLLLNVAKLDPSIDDNLPLINAIDNNNFYISNLLLNNDSFKCYNYQIIKTMLIKKNWNGLVKILDNRCLSNN